MPKKPVNDGVKGEGWLLLVVVAWGVLPAAGAISEFLNSRLLLSDMAEPATEAVSKDAVGFALLLGAVFAWIVLGGLSWNQNWVRVLRAGFMCVAGAFTFSLLCLLFVGLISTALILAVPAQEYPVLGMILRWFLTACVSMVPVAPSYWAGWRFGRYGAAWGALATLLLLSFVEAGSAGFMAEVGPAWIGALILAGAFVGMLGTRKFQKGQRSLAKGTGDHQDAPAPSALPRPD
jgi:hypothetical protein